MAEERRHLSVVRTENENDELRRLSMDVPTRLQRVYDWDSARARDLFSAINRIVARGGYTAGYFEDMLDMDGLAEEYLKWLAYQPKGDA